MRILAEVNLGCLNKIISLIKENNKQVQEKTL